MIKADAYGHGLVPVGKALRSRVDGFAVARFSEARQLRINGIRERLLLLSTWPDLDELQDQHKSAIMERLAVSRAISL